MNQGSETALQPESHLDWCPETYSRTDPEFLAAFQRSQPTPSRSDPSSTENPRLVGDPYKFEP